MSKAQVCAALMGATLMGAAQVCAALMSAALMGAAQVCVAQVCAGLMSTAQVCAALMSAAGSVQPYGKSISCRQTRACLHVRSMHSTVRITLIP